MKKLSVLLVSLLFLAVTVSADFNLIVSGGYEMLSMQAFNENISDLSETRDIIFTDSTADLVSHAVYGTLDIMIPVFPFLSVGPRLGYTYGLQGKIDSRTNNDNNIVTVFDSSMIPLELGANINLQLPGSTLSLIAGGYAGYGLAFMNIKQTNTFLGYSDSGAVSYMGGGLMFDITGAVNFKVSKSMDFGFNIAYRIAQLTDFAATADSTDSGIIAVNKNEKLGTLSGLNTLSSGSSAATLDFSGVMVGLDLNMAF